MIFLGFSTWDGAGRRRAANGHAACDGRVGAQRSVKLALKGGCAQCMGA